jgi:hypothetical protein
MRKDFAAEAVNKIAGIPRIGAADNPESARFISSTGYQQSRFVVQR